jgi:hypothetical protein
MIAYNDIIDCFEPGCVYPAITGIHLAGGTANTSYIMDAVVDDPFINERNFHECIKVNLTREDIELYFQDATFDVSNDVEAYQQAANDGNLLEASFDDGSFFVRLLFIGDGL